MTADQQAVGPRRLLEPRKRMGHRPYLIGPGSIHVAHTLEERIPQSQISEAVQIYKRMVQQLS